MQRGHVVLALGALVACGDASHSAVSPAAFDARTPPAPRYELEVVDATLGGTVAVGTAIANGGDVAGYSTLAEGGRHAVLWRDGMLRDLGTLGGSSSAVQWPGISGTGTVVGISFTADADPHDANWSCEAFMGASDRTCLGFHWQGDRMEPLPTLGGHNGFATSVNRRGQIVGWAETAEADDTCEPPQVLGFQAVLWEPSRGTKQALPPLPGDAASAATAINDRGQVVGISGSCYVAVGDSSARASVLWENGAPTEIPNLGGVTWNTPMDINDAGHVVGFSNLGDDPVTGPRLRAFLWTGGDRALQLGPLVAGETLSQAYGINARGQVVGRSCGPVGCRAFLYDRGVIHDLNDLVDRQGGTLELARHINDAGVITGHLTRGDSVKIFIARPAGRARTP